jgi:hypothetical protein
VLAIVVAFARGVFGVKGLGDEVGQDGAGEEGERSCRAAGASFTQAANTP